MHGDFFSEENNEEVIGGASRLSGYISKVTGKQLKDMLLYMLRDEAFEKEHTEFYQLSKNLYVEYSRKTKTIDSFKFKGKNIKETDIFTLGYKIIIL